MEVFNRVKSIISRQLVIDENEIKMESSFVDDFGIDSLDFVELIMTLEEEFNMEIPDQDLVQIFTVSDAVKYIQGTAIN